MERSGIQEMTQAIPDSAVLHPGYRLNRPRTQFLPVVALKALVSY